MWKFIQLTIHWNKTQMLKNFFSDKINGTKTFFLSFFLSRAPTHDSFTFNLQFLYELKCMVYLPKTVCGIFHFRFRLVFIRVYIFVQLKAWNFENPIILLQIKIIEKPDIVLLPVFWFSRCKRNLKIQWLENRSFEYVTFS